MTLQIPAGFAQVAIVLRMPGDQDPWNVTWGISVSPTADKDAVAAKMGAAWASSFLPFMSDDVDMINVKVAFGTGVEGESLLVESPTLDSGGSGGAYLPQNCALLVKKATSRGGRHGKGRFFVPAFLPEGQVDNVGNISDGVLANGVTASSALRTALADDAGPADETPMFLLHNEDGGDPNEVTALSIDRVISTQRRRLR
jgi:hypothetical protein